MKYLCRSHFLMLLLIAISLISLAGCERAEEIIFGKEPTLVSPASPEAAPVTPIIEPDPAETDTPTVEAEPPTARGTPIPLDPALRPLAIAGEQAMFEGDYDQAIANWREVVEQTANDLKPPWVLSLARAYMADGQYDLAVAQLSWIIAAGVGPELRTEALGLQGSAKEAQGDWQGAVEA